jgi:hypothetical protein
MQIEQRTQELLDVKDRRRLQHEEEIRRAAERLGMPPTELFQRHRQELAELDDQIRDEQQREESKRKKAEEEARNFFAHTWRALQREMAMRREAAHENIIRIRGEIAQRVKGAEGIWQQEAGKWLALAKRKVEVKLREDQEAKASKGNRKK